MKSVLLILLLAIGASAQTLTETLDFIAEKLAGSQVNLGAIAFATEFHGAKGCDVSWTESLFTSGKPIRSRVTLSLKTTTDFSVEKNAKLAMWEVTYKTTAPARLQSLDPLGNLGRVEEFADYPLKARDEAVANQLAKAFNHVTTFCRNKPELFK